MSQKISKKEQKARKLVSRMASPKGVAKEILDKILPPEPIPYDIKVDEAAIERLVTARIALLLRKPFFGNLATRLILRNADEWLPTAATDGKYFYYNSRFIGSLRDKEVEFLFGHEVLHVVYDHMGRRNSRHPELWNIANDYLVNFDLVEDRVGERITTVDILYDSKYGGWASEAVYDDLFEKAKEAQKKREEKECDGDGDGDGDDGKEAQGGGKPGKGKGRSNNMPSNKDIRDALGDAIDKVLDEHLGEGGDGDEENEDGKSGPAPGPVPMSEAERKALKEEIRQATLNAAKQAGAGNVPGGVKRMIQDLTESKISWQELIAQEIESTIKDDYSFMKPRRGMSHIDAILPGMIPGKTVDVCIAIDTSGSISTQMLREFLSEVKGIMEQYDDYNIHLWCFDTEIHNPEKFTSENMRDIAEYEPGGFGGTDFEVNWTWMKENEVQPEKFIMFTDGYPFASWGDPDYCDTVFIINGNKNEEPPFGAWAYYDEI